MYVPASPSYAEVHIEPLHGCISDMLSLSGSTLKTESEFPENVCGPSHRITETCGCISCHGVVLV